MGMFQFFWARTKNQVAGSFGNSFYNLLRNRRTVFHGGCAVCIPPATREGFSVSTSSTNTCCFLLNYSRPRVCVTWYLTLVLMMTNDVEHLSMCLLAFGILTLERYLIRFL